MSLRSPLWFVCCVIIVPLIRYVDIATVVEHKWISNNNFKNFLIDNFGERGKKVSPDFEYSSGSNDNFLSINQINKINKTL